MSKTKAGTADARSNQPDQGLQPVQAMHGSGRHRGQAAGGEESGQRARGRHRRPPGDAEAERA